MKEKILKVLFWFVVLVIASFVIEYVREYIEPVSSWFSFGVNNY